MHSRNTLENYIMSYPETERYREKGRERNNSITTSFTEHRKLTQIPKK